MKTNEQKNTTTESFGISDRRSEGVAGPSREVSKRDAAASGAPKAGQEKTHEQNVQPGDTARHKGTRARGLCGPGTGQERASKSTPRKRTGRDLPSTAAGEAYTEREEDIREFFSSLMEHQDQMYNATFCKVRDLECQIKDLKCSIGDSERRIYDLESTMEDPECRTNDFEDAIDEIEQQFNDLGCSIAVSELRIRDLEHTLGIPERRIDELLCPIEELTCRINDPEYRIEDPEYPIEDPQHRINDFKHSMGDSERWIDDLKLCTESPATEQPETGMEERA